MKREKVYRAFIEPDAMVPTWQPGHFQAAPLWQPVGRSGLTVLSNVRCRQLRCVAALGRKRSPMLQTTFYIADEPMRHGDHCP